jgi:hypothetical protein
MLEPSLLMRCLEPCGVHVVYLTKPSVTMCIDPVNMLSYGFDTFARNKPGLGAPESSG